MTRDQQSSGSSRKGGAPPPPAYEPPTPSDLRILRKGGGETVETKIAVSSERK